MALTTLKISYNRLLEIEKKENNPYLIYQIDDNHWLNADEDGSRVADERDNVEEFKAMTHGEKSFITPDEEVSNQDGEPARILIGSITLNHDDGTFIFEGDQTVSIADQFAIQRIILEH
ncbi:MAG: hypothetical protein ACOH2A_10020 [Sphingobacteriaceae bacterium]